MLFSMQPTNESELGRAVAFGKLLRRHLLRITLWLLGELPDPPPPLGQSQQPLSQPPEQQSAQSLQTSQSGAGSSTDPPINGHDSWIIRATEQCSRKMRLLGVPERFLGRVLASEPRGPHLPSNLVHPEVESHRRLRNVIIDQILRVIQQIYDCSDGWPPVFRGLPLRRIRGGPSPELLVDNLNEHVQALVTGQAVDELLINDLTEYLTRITLWLAGELDEPPTLLGQRRPPPPPPPPANPPPSTPAVQSPPAQASLPNQNQRPPTAPGPSPPRGASQNRRANGGIVQ